MIYDCFSFFNELDLLEIRLNILNNVVDKFVLVEATKTHTGKDKPLFFEENRKRFAAFQSKIIHIVVDDFPTPPTDYTEKQASWMRENFQRNAIARGLGEAQPDDFILVSDLDEIPDSTAIQKASNMEGVILFEQLFSNFYLNFISFTTPFWPGTKATKYKYLSDFATFSKMEVSCYVDSLVNEGPSATRLRYVPHDHKIRDAGWHFSYLGNAKSIVTKIDSIAIEYANENSNSEKWITSLIETGMDITGCGRRFFAVPLDKRFPQYIRENEDKYSSLICKMDQQYFMRTKWERRKCFIRGWIRRNGAKVIPPFMKRFLFEKVYCKIAKNPIRI